jgi:arsenate reductase
MPAPPHVLFLGSGNACRSQMAEAWLRRLGGDGVVAASAGTAPGTMAPMTAAAMAEAGLDLSGQHPKGLDGVDLDGVTHVVTVCDAAARACPDFPREVNRRHWSVPDPAGLAEDFPHLINDGFRAIRDNLRDRVCLLLRELGREPLPFPAPPPSDSVDSRGDRP